MWCDCGPILERGWPREAVYSILASREAGTRPAHQGRSGLGRDICVVPCFVLFIHIQDIGDEEVAVPCAFCDGTCSSSEELRGRALVVDLNGGLTVGQFELDTIRCLLDASVDNESAKTEAFTGACQPF